MPTILTHAVAALALGPAVPPAVRRAKLWGLGALCAVLPDADVVAFRFGIPYESVFGHRGITHSLAFAAALALVVVAVAYRCSPHRLALWAFFFAATASHALLDMLTDGGLGVALFAPLDTNRWFFPWRPIEVSPIGVAGFLSARGVAVLASEARWVWAPALGAAAVLLGLRRARGRRAS